MVGRRGKSPAPAPVDHITKGVQTGLSAISFLFALWVYMAGGAKTQGEWAQFKTDEQTFDAGIKVSLQRMHDLAEKHDTEARAAHDQIRQDIQVQLRELRRDIETDMRREIELATRKR